MTEPELIHLLSTIEAAAKGITIARLCDAGPAAAAQAEAHQDAVATATGQVLAAFAEMQAQLAQANDTIAGLLRGAK